MKILLGISIILTLFLGPEATPAHLSRERRGAESSLLTDYHAKFTENDKKGCGTIKGSHEFHHSSCSGSIDDFAKRCSIALTGLLEQIANFVSSKPNSAKDFDMDINSRLKHSGASCCSICDNCKSTVPQPPVTTPCPPTTRPPPPPTTRPPPPPTTNPPPPPTTRPPPPPTTPCPPTTRPPPPPPTTRPPPPPTTRPPPPPTTRPPPPPTTQPPPPRTTTPGHSSKPPHKPGHGGSHECSEEHGHPKPLPSHKPGHEGSHECSKEHSGGPHGKPAQGPGHEASHKPSGGKSSPPQHPSGGSDNHGHEPGHSSGSGSPRQPSNRSSERRASGMPNVPPGPNFPGSSESRERRSRSHGR